ncbi:MAG: SpoVA/SpoVAEb family sporulation membrane protein [Ruminococcus sp.]|uniref:SpoVA/SpoVAEb family sporulation membrane protein n=1 Tax=Ruminococcus sp. TaxID=41978 RepID=UPI002E75B0DA|nr:SpoVA/SpoVAEb family sporulation membrane protein [Ruminococcus sp.]MBQ1453667.1 SpoVA/SpoVAEb family sporulation membrane protein [Ruminococcus sp.]MEE1262195.1 SpoVA/SpoVAEb family sporulation membrane protein [Ruminococcus sp.]
MQYIYAFLVGGAICLIGQLLIDKTKLTPAKILTGFVIAGVALSALGLYQPLADFAGEGAAVPLSGFGNLMAEGMKDALREDGALGILTGALKSAAAGIGAAIVFSLLCGLIGKAKGKD